MLGFPRRGNAGLHCLFFYFMTGLAIGLVLGGMVLLIAASSRPHCIEFHYEDANIYYNRTLTERQFWEKVEAMTFTDRKLINASVYIHEVSCSARSGAGVAEG